MSEGKARRGGKKNRKFGRAARKPKTAKYKLLNMRLKNKIRKLKKHLKYHPTDGCALGALQRT